MSTSPSTNKKIANRVCLNQGHKIESIVLEETVIPPKNSEHPILKYQKFWVGCVSCALSLAEIRAMRHRDSNHAPKEEEPA